MWSNRINLFEHPEKMLAVHRSNRRDLLQVDITGVVCFHPVPGGGDTPKYLQPGRSLDGLDILRMFVSLLVPHQQRFEEFPDLAIGLQRRKRRTTASQLDQRQ